MCQHRCASRDVASHRRVQCCCAPRYGYVAHCESCPSIPCADFICWRARGAGCRRRRRSRRPTRGPHASTRPASPPPRRLPRTRHAAAPGRQRLRARRPRPTRRILQVLNQSIALENYNAFAVDPTLREALDLADAGWAESHVSELGEKVGSAAWVAKARAANEHKPVLATHDRFGRHVDVVEYHRSYHELMRLSLESGVASLCWDHGDRPGAHSARAALMYLMYQLEQAHMHG